MARVSAERAEEQAKSDDERSVLEEDAARYSGAWFRSQGRTDRGPAAAGQRRPWSNSATTARPSKTPASWPTSPRSRTPRPSALVRWVKKNLFLGGKLRDDERLIVFTEYKETLFYLEQRLLQEGFDKNTLRLLYGGMNADEFEAVKSRV